MASPGGRRKDCRRKRGSARRERVRLRRFSKPWLEQSTSKIQEKRQNRRREDHGRDRDEHPCVLSLIADVSGELTEPRKPAEADDKADENRPDHQELARRNRCAGARSSLLTLRLRSRKADRVDALVVQHRTLFSDAFDPARDSSVRTATQLDRSGVDVPTCSSTRRTSPEERANTRKHVLTTR